jgi:hypothetical protein
MQRKSFAVARNLYVHCSVLNMCIQLVFNIQCLNGVPLVRPIYILPTDMRNAMHFRRFVLKIMAHFPINKNERPNAICTILTGYYRYRYKHTNDIDDEEDEQRRRGVVNVPPLGVVLHLLRIVLQVQHCQQPPNDHERRDE